MSGLARRLRIYGTDVISDWQEGSSIIWQGEWQGRKYEDLAQDALVIAQERWPESGIPNNPGAWLMATAKNRAIDRLRRNTVRDRKHEELGRQHDVQQELSEAHAEEATDSAIGDDIGDDLLRLMFTACRPVLSLEARVALSLRLLGGLTTQEIVRAFLAPEPTVAQRIVRTKRTLAESHVPLEVPRGDDRAARLASVWIFEIS